MREIVLFFIISLSCLNANAQLGDFFRKLGDTIDSVSKKTAEDPKNQSNEESNNQAKEEGSSSNTLQPIGANDIPEMLGRWSNPKTCNSITDRKAGSYIFNNDNDLVIENIDERNSELVDTSVITKMERYSKDGKLFIRGSGTYSDRKNKIYKVERIWDISNITNKKSYS